MAYADIKLGSTFDAKGFKQAETAVNKLEKGVKGLAKTFGLAFGTAAVVSFGKASLKAFQEDEAAALRLSRAVENLGVGFANPAISKFISDLERSAGVADDVLRPAFQALLTTTGSLIQSQKLLNDAITISRASGIDLATVSEDLAKGYVGNTKALAKYNTGLTKTELSTKSFSDILGILLTKSAGAASDYLDTTAYQMDILGVATSNASEIIGGGLVDAFAAIGGGTEASDAAAAIESIATAIAKVTTATGKTIGTIPTLLANLKKLGKDIFLGFAGAQAGVKLTPTPTPTKLTKTPEELSKIEQAKRLAKLEADAAKRAKLLAAMQTKSLKAEQDKAKLAKAARLLELKQINIAAALKGKISEEDKIRLQLMQAILDEDADKAEELAKKLEKIQKQTADIAADLLEIGKATDPFATWSVSLAATLIELNKVGEKMFAIRQKESGFVDTSILGGTGTTFPKDATPEQVLAIVEEAVKIAETAATDAAVSVEQTQTVTEALAKSADAAVAIAETLGIIDTANILGVNADIANQTQSSSIFNPYAGMTTESVAAATAAKLIAEGSNAGAGTSSSMFNPYGGAVGGPGFGTANPQIYVTVNNTGSVIMQDDFVDAVNNALLAAGRSGYSRTPAGFLVDGG
jgi:hypothetical protein